MTDLKTMETKDLQEVLHSIFECSKSVDSLESGLKAVNTEMELLLHLQLAFKLIDRGTD